MTIKLKYRNTLMISLVIQMYYLTDGTFWVTEHIERRINMIVNDELTNIHNFNYCDVHNINSNRMHRYYYRTNSMVNKPYDIIIVDPPTKKPIDYRSIFHKLARPKFNRSNLFLLPYKFDPPWADVDRIHIVILKQTGYNRYDILYERYGNIPKKYKSSSYLSK